jgi:hypothetical protein
MLLLGAGDGADGSECLDGTQKARRLAQHTYQSGTSAMRHPNSQIRL